MAFTKADRKEVMGFERKDSRDLVNRYTNEVFDKKAEYTAPLKCNPEKLNDNNWANNLFKGKYKPSSVAYNKDRDTAILDIKGKTVSVTKYPDEQSASVSVPGPLYKDSKIQNRSERFLKNLIKNSKEGNFSIDKEDIKYSEKDFGLKEFKRVIPKTALATGTMGALALSLAGPQSAMLSAGLTAGMNVPLLIRALGADDKKEAMKRDIIKKALKDANFSIDDELTIPVESAEDLAQKTAYNALITYVDKIKNDKNRWSFITKDCIASVNTPASVLKQRDEDECLTTQEFDNLI